MFSFSVHLICLSMFHHFIFHISHLNNILLLLLSYFHFLHLILPFFFTFFSSVSIYYYNFLIYKMRFDRHVICISLFFLVISDCILQELVIEARKTPKQSGSHQVNFVLYIYTSVFLNSRCDFVRITILSMVEFTLRFCQKLIRRNTKGLI